MYTLKAISTIFLISSIIIFTGVYSQNHLTKTSDKLIQQINEVQNKIEDDDWENATLLVKRLNEDWQQTSKTWSVVLDHFELDAVNMYLARTTKFIESKNSFFSTVELASLRKHIAHMPEKDSVIIKNIL